MKNVYIKNDDNRMPITATDTPIIGFTKDKFFDEQKTKFQLDHSDFFFSKQEEDAFPLSILDVQSCQQLPGPSLQYSGFKCLSESYSI